MNRKLKSGILSGVILGSVFMVHDFLNRGQAEGSTEGKEIVSETFDPIDGSQSMRYDIYNNEMELIGQAVVEPSVFDLLNDKGYSIDSYGLLAEGVLEGHDYSSFENTRGATTTDVNFRTGPGIEFDIIETLDDESPVELIASCDNGWYLVQNKGRLGFIRGDYIHQISDQLIASQMENLPEVISAVRAKTDVNVRPESNTDNVEYGVLKQGNTLPFRRRLENGWYEVEYEGKVAYVSGDFVEPTYAISGDFLKLAALNQTTKIYEEPYGYELGELPSLEVCKVYGEVGEFYYVECNGKIGFVPKGNCESLTGTYVIVDISEQQLTLYQDGKVILTSPVVSGKDSTPSDLGLFDIYAKAMDTYLTGPGYSTHVDYWMPYNGGEGLHDASWRSVFGGEIYHDSGSHGCVNLPTDVAHSIYDNVHVGDKVLVKG